MLKHIHSFVTSAKDEEGRMFKLQNQVLHKLKTEMAQQKRQRGSAETLSRLMGRIPEPSPSTLLWSLL
jgi:hypothetical protein